MLTPLQRAKLAQELAAKVREVGALPARTPGGDEGPLLVLKRVRLAKETNELLALLFGEPGDDAVGRAQAYFRENLQGRAISTQIGEVRLLGSSFKEMKRGMKSDALKAKLIRFVPEILTSGDYSGRLPLNKVRGDHFVAFHFFRKKIEINGLSVVAGVNVGERDDGHLAWGLGHEFTTAWHKKKETPGSSRGNEPRAEGASLDAASDTPDPNLHDTGEGVNIIILAVHDKDGNRVPELEDAQELAEPALSLLSTRKVKGDLMDGNWVEVKLSNGQTHEIQRLNSTESMGLPGWHDRGRTGDRPSERFSYLGDTQGEAISSLIARINDGTGVSEPAQAAIKKVAPATLDAVENEAPDGWALFDGMVDASCPVLDYVGSEKLMALRGELAGVLARLESAALPVLQRMAMAREAAELTARIAKRETLKPVKLQNRDRSTAASIAQVRSIGANPDPDLLGVNKTPTEGAPMVFTDYDELKLPAGQLGRKTTVTFTKDMSKIPVQYAVVEADMVMVSHDANGMPVAGFDDMEAPGVFRAVAGNGRAAGIQLAYADGTAQVYVEGLIAEADMSLVSKDAILAMKQPMLVRIMQHAAVTSDIADKTNTSGMAGFSAVEQAKTDGERVDFASLTFNDDGTPTLDSLVKFVQGMPLSEQAALAPDGTPTTQALDRMMAATFSRAYQSDDLVKLYSQSLDPEIKNVLFGMAQAAGDMAALAGAGDYDIRQFVTDAAGLASNAKRSGLPLARLAEQRDMAMPEAVNDIAAMFARNARAAKRIGEALRALARAALSESEKEAEDMFGPVEKTPAGSLVLQAMAPAQVTLDAVRERAALDRELLAMGMRPDNAYVERTYGAGWKMAPLAMSAALDDASMQSNPALFTSVDSTVIALAATAGRLASMVETQNAAITAALNAKPAPIELTIKNEAMRVTLEQPAAVVNVTLPEFPKTVVNVEPASVVVHVPEQAAPVVNITNEVPAAQVVVNGPSQSIAEVQRDPATQEILRTVTTHIQQEPA